MADPYTVTRESHPDSPDRWIAAYTRALANGLMIRPGLFGGPLWVVTSGSRTDLVYATDGEVCGCMAGEKGDPVCQHRALFRAVHGTLPLPANVVAFPDRHDPPSAA